GEVRALVRGALSEGESKTLGDQSVPGIADRGDLERVMREAGGHPLFLHEILRHQEQGAPGGNTLDDALWGRVGVLGPDARRLLECICIAGQPIATDIAMNA